MARYGGMEELIVTQGRVFRPNSPAVRDALAAYQTAAWRAPSATRFDHSPANDFQGRAETVAPTIQVAGPVPAEPMPRWFFVLLGSVLAAILGALVGGVMAV